MKFLLSTLLLAYLLTAQTTQYLTDISITNHSGPILAGTAASHDTPIYFEIWCSKSHGDECLTSPPLDGPSPFTLITDRPNHQLYRLSSTYSGFHSISAGEWYLGPMTRVHIWAYFND